MRRSKRIFLGVLAGLAMSGGVAVVMPPAAKSAVPPCTGGDYTMQCALAHVGRPSLKQEGAPLARVVAQGADFSWSSLTASAAKALGFNFGISYLSYSAAKDWTQGFWNAYHQLGLGTVMVWEWGCCDAGNGYATGQQEARQALAEANALGAPSSRPIYFAVDYDTSWSNVASYFQGVASVVGLNRTGIYGSYYVVHGAMQAGYRWCWNTYAWSNGLWESRCQLQQYQNGIAYDNDRAMAVDYGQTPAPLASVAHNMSGLANATGAFSWTDWFWGIHGTPGTWHSGSENFWASAEVQVDLCGSQAGGWRVASLPRDAAPLGGGQAVSWSTVRGAFAGFDTTFNASTWRWSINGASGSWRPPAHMCGWLSAEQQFQTRTGQWRIRHMSLNAAPLGG